MIDTKTTIMSKVEVDSHGRIYLPKEIREQYGDTFRIVPYRGELKLVPIPDDPVEDLREKTEGLRKTDTSIDELKEQARDRLEETAGE